MLRQCDACGKRSRSLTRGEHPNIPGVVWYSSGWHRFWNYCPSCVDSLIEPFRQPCQRCGQRKLLIAGLCQPCTATIARDNARLRHRLREASKRAQGVVTPAQWRALCAYFGGTCLCCGQVAPLVMDHVIPVSKGGPNTIENIQPLCQPCNNAKFTKSTDYRDPETLGRFLASL